MIDQLPPPPNAAQSQSGFDDSADAWAAALSPWTTQANALAASMTRLAAGTAISLSYKFSAATSLDPTAGYLRLNNATQNTTTELALDLVDAEGVTQTTLIDTLDDSTSTIKGFFGLVNAADQTKWMVLSFTALTSPSGYKSFAVVVVASSSASPFVAEDLLIVKFTRNGDKGDTGVTGGTSQALVERTSNTVITNADTGKLIRITSGTFSQTYDAVATFASTFFIDYENTGSGDVTHDPSGAETIDTRTTIPQYTKEKRRIRPNAAGTAWETTVIKPFFRTTQNSDPTAPVPTGYNRFGARATGGGGSGGTGGGGASGSGSGTGSGGGGGGATAGGNAPSQSREFAASLLGAAVAIVVGAGGAAVATVGAGGVGSAAGNAAGTVGAVGTNGNSGGTTTFAAATNYALSAVGGNAGVAGPAGQTGAGSAQAATGTAAGSNAVTAAPTGLIQDAIGVVGTQGAVGIAGTGGVSGGQGGNGGGAAAGWTGTAGAAAAGGPVQTVILSTGNAGATGSAAPSAGQGSGGGGGGGGSRGGAGAGSGNGGAGGPSLAGANGQVEWWGIL